MKVKNKEDGLSNFIRHRGEKRKLTIAQNDQNGHQMRQDQEEDPRNINSGVKMNNLDHQI